MKNNNYLIKLNSIQEKTIDKTNSDLADKEVLVQLVTKCNFQELFFLMKDLFDEREDRLENLFPFKFHEPNEIEYDWLFIGKNHLKKVTKVLEKIYIEALKSDNIQIIDKLHGILYTYEKGLNLNFIENIIKKIEVDKSIRLDLLFIWQKMCKKQPKIEKFQAQQVKKFSQIFDNIYFLPAKINIYKKSNPFKALEIFVQKSQECFYLQDDLNFFFYLKDILESVIFNCALKNEEDLLRIIFQKIQNQRTYDFIFEIWNEKGLQHALKYRNIFDENCTGMENFNLTKEVSSTLESVISDVY